MTPKAQTSQEQTQSSRLKTLRARYLVQNLDLKTASGIEEARWEHFQIAHLNNESIFGIENKSRQIAWSFTVAAEAVAEALLHAQDTIFVSINLEEAKEKIRYARRIYECIRLAGLPKLITDNQLELEFANRARITSLPSKPPRGRAKSNVVLDEFAHVQHDKQIYTAAPAVISKGGRLRIGSSAFGAAGVFYEIFAEKQQKYPGFTRKTTPWWEVQAFCLNVREARKLAPPLETSDRVELFGNPRIKAIFANTPLEDFQQEYEGIFVDETTAWVTWEEIEMAQQDPEHFKCVIASMRDAEPEPAFEAIEQLTQWVHNNKVESVFAGGLDVGRTRNASEFFLVGMSTTQSYPLRLALTLNNVPFEIQEAVIQRALDILPIAGLMIDRNGLGMMLAENLTKKYPGKVRGVDFTNESKKLWATDIKMYFQKKNMLIPKDKDLAYQIHSIKKIVSASKNLIFDTTRNAKHHADKFWALALALASAITNWIQEDELPGTYGFSY